MSETEEYELQQVSTGVIPVTPDNGDYNWFRCEPMELCQMFLQSDSAYQTVGHLGQLGICQFRDLNKGQDINVSQRKFVAELQRCNELEKKLAYFLKELERDKLPLGECEEPAVPSVREIPKLETQFEQLEKDLRQVNTTRLDLKKQLLGRNELRYILQYVDAYFSRIQQETPPPSSVEAPEANLRRRFSISLGAGNTPQIPLEVVVDLFTFTGSIQASRFNSFEKILWRLSHGNILLNKFPMEEKLEDPETGELQDKFLFILVCQGEKLRNICVKICESYHTGLYNCPQNDSQRNDLKTAVIRQIEDLITVIDQTDEHRKRILVAAAKNLRLWQMTVVKMKSIYVVMNCFMITGNNLIGEAWIPRSKIQAARSALLHGQRESQSTIASALTTVSTDETPPTLNVTNRFTAGFQMIIDSYGVASYGEVNPAPYACITFPFIFAIMFGDTGHGLLMALFGFWLCWNEKKLASVKDEIFSMFFGGRYIILLMGLFSIYTGIIYNDIFAKSMNIFGSAFTLNTKLNGLHPCSANGTEQCFPKERLLSPVNEVHEGYYYPIGVDPIWQISENKVLFLNSFKMKMSVTIGVLQMLFGVLLSIANHIRFKKFINIFVEFIPQVIFLLAIFGYMVFMIFFKFFAYNEKNSGCAPSVLITMITMFMPKEPLPTDPCYLRDEMYEGQRGTVQMVLVVLGLLMIPIMLLIKPFYLRSVNARKMRNAPRHNDIESPHMRMTKIDEEEGNGHAKPAAKPAADTSGHGDHGEGKEFDFGDTFINQAIHTIEYCLGSVSHTASYLRLWALSLAHAQLSEVLWHMVLANGFMMNGVVSGIFMYIVFAAWATLTVSILIVMEGLSAFLHALRLHWVEFMSKFYSGSGYAFTPFSFKEIFANL